MRICSIRFSSSFGAVRTIKLDQEELFDLADALHNIGGILADYGAWTADEKYRQLYLRPFDRKWGNESLRLEAFLQSRLPRL
jgi:hypothetical protein